MVTVSAWRNGAGAATEGVGFLLSISASVRLSKPHKTIWSSRVLTISFNGNPRHTTTTAYSPTEAAPVEEADQSISRQNLPLPKKLPSLIYTVQLPV